MKPREAPAQIEEQAARWVMRIDREGRSPALIADLDHWLAGDSRRAGALLQAEAAWLMLDRLGGREVAAVAGHDSVIRISRRHVLAGGATALAASLVGGLFLASAPDRFQTSVGEIRRVPLADGSTAAINTRSRISVALAPKQRLVRIDEGEAWFQVAKDRTRPFVVTAGRVHVRAVGTAFSVRRYNGGADVLVTEGVVEAWVDGPKGPVVRLAAGQQAYVADNGPITQPPSQPSDVDRALSWRAGKIDLAGEPLERGVAEFNRYNERQIRIVDPNLARERFYGVFRTDDPEGFAAAVRRSLDVPVDFSQPDEIRIG
jgi:transmembrane sensor